MATFAELRVDLLKIAGLDVDEDTGLRWLSDRHIEMVARARAFRKALTLAATTGDDTIAAPSIVELYRLKIGGSTYKRVRSADIDKARASQLIASWPSLLFASEASTAGAATFEVYPTPGVGLAVEVFAAVRPGPAVEGDEPLVPVEYQRALIEGAYATGLGFDTEQTGAADRFEQRFDGKCEELRRAVRRQYRGSGPAQILVQGVNA